MLLLFSSISAICSWQSSSFCFNFLFVLSSSRFSSTISSDDNRMILATRRLRCNVFVSWSDSFFILSSLFSAASTAAVAISTCSSLFFELATHSDRSASFSVFISCISISYLSTSFVCSCLRVSIVWFALNNSSFLVSSWHRSNLSCSICRSSFCFLISSCNDSILFLRCFDSIAKADVNSFISSCFSETCLSRWTIRLS